MHRWGNNENHTYPIGVFSTRKKAKESGSKEESYRGGKYTSCLYRTLLDPIKEGYIPTEVTPREKTNPLFVSKKDKKDIVLVKEQKCRDTYGNYFVCYRKLLGSMESWILPQKAFYAIYKEIKK